MAQSDSSASEPPGSELDSATTAYLRSRLESEQNLLLGVLGGLAAAAVGAGLWAGITVLTGWQIGFMAVGVGFLVGVVVRFLGRGVTSIFGVVGGALALLGCAVGNLLAVTALAAAGEGISLLDALPMLTPELISELMVATFSPMDLVFYGIAVYEGYRLSFRELTEAELKDLLSQSAP